MDKNAPDTDPYQQLINGTLWDAYCDALKLTGRHLLRTESPGDPFNQAEGLRYLTRMVRAGLESLVESSEAEFPRFADPATSRIKIGADNPDNRYMTARIRGHHIYKLMGHRGTVANINFATKGGGFQKSNKKMAGTGFLSGQDLKVDEDGSFEIMISKEQPASGNWLPMDDSSNMLLIRQTFNDRDQEQPADLTISCLTHTAPPAPLSPEAFAARLMAAANYTENTVKLFADWSGLFKEKHYNCLPLGDQSMYLAAGGDPNITYYHGYWELADDEVMVIELTPPECEFWNFQVDNYWMESLDYQHHKIHVNCHGAHYNADGSVALVIAHKDPGHPNWLTTAGHQLGTSLFRLIGAEQIPPEIPVRIEKFDNFVAAQ